MKRFVLIATCLMLSFAQDQVVHVLFTNDLHGVFGPQEATFMNPEFPPTMTGFAGFVRYRRALIKQAEAENQGVLTLDAGNFFQGNPIATLDSGRSAINFMDGIYDALTPGSYDFIFGTENLGKLNRSATFPMLGANLKQQKDLGIKPYIIKKVGDTRIGILGIVSSQIEVDVKKRNLKGVQGTSEIDAVKEWIPKVRQAGADVIIILASTGVPYDREDEYKLIANDLKQGTFDPRKGVNSLSLAHYAEGADVLISGGVSRGYDDPWFDPNSHVAVLQNYGGGSEFGHVKLIIDPQTKLLKKIENASRTSINVSLMADEFPADAEFLKRVRMVEADALKKLYTPIKLEAVAKKRTAGKERRVAENVRKKQFNIPKKGTDAEFDIITWNLEFFPASDQATIDALAEAVQSMDVDMIALQEIRHVGWISRLMKHLPEYDFISSIQASFMDLAILYKKDLFTFVRQREPFAENDYNFAGRPPLRGDFVYHSPAGQNIPVSIFNVHMKCCSSGLERRQKAVKQLHEYIVNDYAAGNRNHIVLGDWNDDLKDPPNEHSFHPFFDDSRFFFTNKDLVYDPKQQTYPHPPWTSYLDHIMVSDGVLKTSDNYHVETIMMDQYVGSMETYEKLLSDHRPVLLRFTFGQN